MLTVEGSAKQLFEVTELSDQIGIGSELVLKYMENSAGVIRASYVITGKPSAKDKKIIHDWVANAPQELNVQLTQSTTLTY